MSDENKNDKKDANDEPNQNDENNQSVPRSISRIANNGKTEEKKDTADIEQSESEILNFFANYGKNEGAFLPHIPTTEAFVYMRIPPDSGYAWVILLISFINEAIIDGIMFCVGRLLPFLIDDLKISSGTAAFIISIQIGLYFAGGPISSILVNRMGFRYVAILGTICAIFGILLASYSTDILFLFIFFGVIVGVSLGMAVLSVQMIVSFYFEKYRSIACGIQSAASGLGVFIFSPLYYFIVTKTGWRNTLRIQGLICCLIIILSFFYHPVQLTRIGKYVEQPLREEETVDSLNSVEIAYDRYSKFLSTHTPDKDGSITLSANRIQPRSTFSHAAKPNPIKTILLKACPKCFLKNCFTKPIDREKDLVVENRRELNVPSNVQRIIIDVPPLEREDIFYAGNPNYEQTANKLDDANISIQPGKEKQAMAINYTISVSRNLVAEQQEPATAKTICPHFTVSAKLMHALHILFDRKVLNSKEFIIFFLSQFFFFLGSNIPYVYLTEHAEIPEEYSNILLSIIGLLNVIIRITAGFGAFLFKINPLFFTGVGIFICGIFTFSVGFFGKDLIWFQFLFCSVFAIASALSASFRSIILVQLIGLDKLTNAYGFNYLGMGIGCFLGTNVGGLIKTYTGKADFAFAFAGISMIISGLLIVFFRLIINHLCVSDHDDNLKRVRFSTDNTNK